MTEVMFAALLWQVIDFLRELRNVRTQSSAVLTQAAAWVGGIALVILGAHANVASNLTLGLGMALKHLDGGSQVLVGLLVSSLGSTGVDIKQAIDNRDSASKPPLVVGGAPPVIPPG